MPELGKHAFAVLASYGATLVLLGALVGVTLARARASRRRLAEAEARRRG